MIPELYINSQMIDLCQTARSIIIIGGSCSGKSSIAEYISSQISHPYVSTDHYLQSNDNDQEKAINRLIVDINNYNKPLIIEGTLGYLLLRKGLQNNSFNPDLIIKLKCNDKTTEYLYEKYRDPSKINYAKGMAKGLEKIWENYKTLLKQNPFIKIPKYIEVETTLSQFKSYL